MLILKPCGRGNWNPVQLESIGSADMHLLGQRVWIEMPGQPRRAYWIRGVLA